MTAPHWLPVALSLLTILFSVGGTLVVVGMFSGKLTEQLKHQNEALTRLVDRMDVFDRFSNESGSDRSQMGARLLAAEKDLERALDTLQKHGERMARVESSVERCAEGEAHINRRLDEVFAQLGTLARRSLGE